MSAFMCDTRHLLHLAYEAVSKDRHGCAPIAYVRDFGDYARAYAATRYERAYSREPFEDLAPRERAAIVYSALYAANVQSLRARYSDPQDMIDQKAALPSAADCSAVEQERMRAGGVPSAVNVLKSIACYEYQACEFDGWETSLAREICRVLKEYAIHRLPGYSAAPWGAPIPERCAPCADHECAVHPKRK